jgi:hypothetical protein
VNAVISGLKEAVTLLAISSPLVALKILALK